MGRFKIICVNKDFDDIIRVGIEGLGLRGVDDVINDISYGGNEYYTTEPYGYPADVLIKPKKYGRFYITTNPDGKQPNNLDSLPSCRE